MPDTLASLYAERAALAHAIEHAPDGAAFLPEYAILQEHLHFQEQAYAAAWDWPHAGHPRLPWCSMCGTRDYALAVGQIFCVSCALTLPPRALPLTDDDLAHQGDGAS